MHYYMIRIIQFLSPHVLTEDYSHIMVGYEVMVVEIVLKSMVTMKAKKSPSPESREGDQSGPKILIFLSTVLYFAKIFMPLGLGFSCI
jgi:hypothetical protein